MSDLPAWVTDPQAATPPLDEYLAVEAEEDNLFWWVGCGHHQNLLAEAVAQRDEARAEVERLLPVTDRLTDRIVSLDLEVERLRAENDEWRDRVAVLEEEARTHPFAAEVERLRAQVQHWMNYATGQNDEANALAAEVERLKNLT